MVTKRIAPALTPDGLGPSGAALWHDPNQTFGIEIELTRFDHETVSPRTWAGLADHVRRTLQETFAAPVSPRLAGEEKSFHHWNVERDETAGWEISSRILSGHEGFREIARALQILDDVGRRTGLRLGPNTGLHLHVGWRPRDHRQLKRFIQLVKIFEPGLSTIVTPSRLVAFSGRQYNLSEPNRYCLPISHVFSKDIMRGVRSIKRVDYEASLQRNTTVNVATLSTLGTVEVRMLGGTLSADVVLMWLSLWQQIIWAASQPSPKHLPSPDDVDVLVPSGDMVALATKYLPELGRARFCSRLHARRRQMAARWRRHKDLAPWLAYAEPWTPPHDARATATETRKA